MDVRTEQNSSKTTLSDSKSMSVIPVNDYDDAVDGIISSEIPESTIEGPPGTGKTSRIPTRFANSGKTVFIAIPTALGVYAAHDYAERSGLASGNYLMGTAAQSKIKYQNNVISSARSFLNGTPPSYNQNTRLVYLTPGSLKKVLLDIIKYANTNDRANLLFCDNLIIDEVHLKTINIEFCLRYWKYLYRVFGRKRVPALIKTSATAPDSRDVHYKLDVQTPFAVQYRYLDNLERAGVHIPDELRTNPRPRDIITAIPNFIRKYVDFLTRDGQATDGTVLVFLPGIKEIRDVQGRLKLSQNHELLVAHSSMTEDESRRLFQPRNANWRIILSTNICETSLTIPDVKLVIDSTLERIPEEGNNGVVYLRTDFISKTSGTQRANRTGRTTDGIVLRCLYKDSYDALQTERSSEIERLSIVTEVLRALDAGVDLHYLLPEFDAKRIRYIQKQLSDLCCLEKCGDFYRTTSVGKFAARMPLSAINATFLYYWTQSVMADDVFPGIVLAVAIEMADSVFDRVPKKTSIIPLGTLLIPYVDYWARYGVFRVGDIRTREFCREYSLSVDGFAESLRRINEIMRIIEPKDYDLLFYNFEIADVYEIAHESIARIYPKLTRHRQREYVSADGKSVYELSGEHLSPEGNYPPVVYGVLFSQGRGRNKQTVTLWVPANYETITEVRETVYTDAIESEDEYEDEVDDIDDVVDENEETQEVEVVELTSETNGGEPVYLNPEDEVFILPSPEEDL
jgi:HrpA-like RNA helicase